MEISNVASPASTGGLGGGIDLADTFDNFLVLLTTQLQNQDPLSPLDTNEFTQQLVEFTNVEQAIKTNDKLDQLVALQGAGILTGALDYIGKQVEFGGAELNLEDGEATVIYDLASNAKETIIEIRDQNGFTVRTLTGPTDAGRQEIVWDGKDDLGNTLPEGTYEFEISALDGDGQPIALSQGTIGQVTGVEVINGIIMLAVGDLSLSLSQITSVKSPDDEGSGST
jgi:flagellar basal-body rod modification protein FlgD